MEQKNSIGTVQNLVFHFAAPDTPPTQRARMTCPVARPNPRGCVIGQDSPARSFDSLLMQEFVGRVSIHFGALTIGVLVC